MARNRLAEEVSPYLLQHADNPVHWYPWGAEAFADAARDNKPILLSVGYAACHWCHVMAHESFEDPDVAAVMNRLFVNVKVDREERPDVDQVYMAALHTLGQQGGWPLTMFLTPEREPFWGGTYFPKTAQYGRPGFTDVLNAVSETFHGNPDGVRQNVRVIGERLSRTQKADAGRLDPMLIDRAAERLASLMDPQAGGTKGAPKFPQAALSELFWRAGERTGSRHYTELVLTTLKSLCQGGIYDHLGGGLARYAVDEHWLVPHFEKMLYDNAQLIELLTWAWAETGDQLFRERIEDIIKWIVREMKLPEGAFAASLDADSEGEEGRFYVWTRPEIDALLPDGQARDLFCAAYDATQAGNWEGKIILNRLATQEPLGDEVEGRLAAMRQILFDHRSGRVPPALDDKILTDWNGLTIAALARAGIVLERPDWLDLAVEAYRFIAESMSDHDRLAHAYRAGRRVLPGLACDYAAMIKAALALIQATGDERYLSDATRWLEALERHHWDAASGGYFLSADDSDDLFMRPKNATDEATPSANGLMVGNLARLWLLTGEEAHRAKAEAILDTFSGEVAENVFATATLLNGFDTLIRAEQIVIVAKSRAEAADLNRAALSSAGPAGVVQVVTDASALPKTHPAFAKTMQNGAPTAYLCRDRACLPPVTSAAELKTLAAVPRL